MKKFECKHIRIRDTNAYGVDVEKFIKSIENQYGIDFTSLSQWEELVKRLHAMTTDCKRKIQDANRRKYVMMSKILVETTRDSPFELTKKLARTHNKWQMMEYSRKFGKQVPLSDEFDKDVSSNPSDEIVGEISENVSTVHQNTEIPDFFEPPSKSDLDIDTRVTETSMPHLPIKICVNQHNLISPLASHETIFGFKPAVSPMDLINRKEPNEWLLLNETTSLKCFPKEIAICRQSLNEQTIKFSVINCGTEYKNIRFMCLTEEFPFKSAKIVPATPKKLYPGITIPYKFIFKLSQNNEEFKTALYFRVGQKVFEEAPIEALCVPVISKFKISRSVLVSETVHAPPSFLWQIREVSGFPSGTLNITSNDEYSYHVHIIKRFVNISREFQDSVASIDAISPNTRSLIDRFEDNEIETQSKVLSSFKDTNIEEVLSIKTTDIIGLVVEDIVDLALDTFILNHTYILLKPFVKRTINVNFVKPERIGSHHSYYDIEFSDSETEELIMTKTIKVFAEVLPHPIQISPRILDMTESPVIHGYCEDDIIINNTHKVFPVTIKIKLTSKMRKLFCVTPMESLVSANSSMNFRVRVCSTDLSKNGDESVHFTIKIVVIGHKSIYDNAPPIFYEIIAPCASEFKKIYNEKYFINLCE